MLPTCLSCRKLFCCLRSFWISCICTAKAGRGMSQASLSASIGPEAVYLVLQHPRQRSVCSAGWEGRRDGWQSRVTRGAGWVCPAVDGMFWRMVNHKAWICWNNLKIHYFFLLLIVPELGPFNQSSTEGLPMTLFLHLCEIACVHGERWVSGCDTHNGSGFYVP